MMISRSVYHYHSVAADQTPLRLRIKELAATRVRYGYKRIHVVLRREGWTINHKRVYRLLQAGGPVALRAPTQAPPLGSASDATADSAGDERVLGHGFHQRSAL